MVGGRLRLELPEDWGRRELVEAFDRGITVIPVLLDGRPRLAPSTLPAEVVALGRCQYVRLRHRHAGADLGVDPSRPSVSGVDGRTVGDDARTAGAVRARLRAQCGDVTRHLLEILG
jgi:hypothetical protein